MHSIQTRATFLKELKYRDRGYMYFPSKEFLLFLRGLDRCVMENANESTFKKYGPEMIKVAVKQIEATQEFKQQFKSLITNRLLELADVNMSKFDSTIILLVYLAILGLVNLSVLHSKNSLLHRVNLHLLVKI